MRVNLELDEFDVKTIIECLNRELQDERNDWGPVGSYPFQYVYRGLTKRGKQIQSTINYIKKQYEQS